MHKSMEILMARMESHPDEFDITFRTPIDIRDSRWGFILRPLMERCEALAEGARSFQLGFLSDDEVREVFGKLMAVQGDACLQKVMNELLQDEHKDARNPRSPFKQFGYGVPYASADDSSVPE